MNQVIENCILVKGNNYIKLVNRTSKQAKIHKNIDCFFMKEYMDRIGQVLITLAVLSFAGVVISRVYIKLIIYLIL